MDRKTHVRFLGGHARVTAHGYPTNPTGDGQLLSGSNDRLFACNEQNSCLQWQD